MKQYDLEVDELEQRIAPISLANNGVGNGIDENPPGSPKPNDGPGTGPGHPGNGSGVPEP